MDILQKRMEELQRQFAAQAEQLRELQQRAAQAAAAPPPPAAAVPPEVTNDIREMVAEIRRQKDVIGELRKMRDDDRDQLREYEARMKELREVASNKTKGIIDSKMLNKPTNFDNKEEHWPEFAFKYENWICGVEASARIYLRWAELHEGEISDLSARPTRSLRRRSRSLASRST